MVRLGEIKIKHEVPIPGSGTLTLVGNMGLTMRRHRIGIIGIVVFL